MDIFQFYHFVDVLTVFLIYEIAFCKCELKSKTPNHRIISYENEFQRKERQAPIDPSRMYLPPRIDSVASRGFGGQIDISNNFSNNNNGYGEVGLVQDTFSYSLSAEGGNYDVPTKTMNGLNGDQTTRSYDIGTSDGFGESSLSPNAGYTSLTSRGTNFERLSAINDDYRDIKLPETNHYRSSLGTSSIPNHNHSADGYGQIELLDTSRNQGLSKNSSNQVIENGQIPDVDNLYDRSTVSSYSNIASNTQKSLPKDNNRNTYIQVSKGNFNSSRSLQYQEGRNGSGYGSMVPNSFGQNSASSSYSQAVIGNIPKTVLSNERNVERNAANSYNQASVDSEFSNLALNNQNNPNKNVPQIINNVNYGQNGLINNQGLHNSDYNQAFSSGHGQYFDGSEAASSTQPYGQNNYRKSNVDFYSTNTDNIPGINQKSLSSLGGFNENRQNLQESNNYGPPHSQTSVKGGYSNQRSSNVQLNDGYGQGIPIGSNGFSQGQTTSSKIPNINDLTSFQSTLSNRNNYGPSISVQSTNGANDQGGSQKGQHRTRVGPYNYNFAPSQALSLNKENSNHYLPINNGYTQRPSQNSNSSKSNEENVVQNLFNRINLIMTQLGTYNQDTSSECKSNGQTNNQHKNKNYDQNGPTIQNLGQGGSSSTSGYGQELAHSSFPSGANIGQNRLSSITTNVGSEIPNQKNHSNFVPKGQYQNSNLLGQNDFVKQNNDIINTPSTTNNNNDFGTPGLNSFSNFAPGNQPNQPNEINNIPSTTSNNNEFGTPGLNSFSNFAPGNQPNQPNEIKNIPSTTSNNNEFGTPGLNSFSNFAPGNQPNQPNEINNIPSTTSNNNEFGTPGLNSFSNFAPGNQPNEINNIQSTTSNNNEFGTPGLNSFSNFAPDNQPNQPNEINNIPSTTNNNNDFGTPGLNSFSNFAPDNQPNQPNEINNIPSTTNNNNDFDTPGLNSFSNFAPDNQPNEIHNIPSTTNNNNDFDTPGLNSFSNFAPDNQPNQPNEINNIPSTTNNNKFGTPGLNSFSNFAPGNQPNEINNIPSTTSNNNEFGNPGLNSFSNFAPGNQPNQPNEINNIPSTTSNNNEFGNPGLNSFSNFAPGNQPNQPNEINNIPSTTNNNNKFGTPGLNSFSNFAPGNQPNEINNIQSTTSNNNEFGTPGLNSFSNFAPGNQLNQPNEINNIPSTTSNNNDFGTPGLNSFSNFAPGNQPNQPIDSGNNNCGTSNNGNNIDKQTKQVSSTSNSIY